MAFDMYGPMIRVVLQAIYDEKAYQEYATFVEGAIAEIVDKPTFVTLLNDSNWLSTSTKNLSHKLCLVRRPTLSLQTYGHIVHAVSPYVQTRLLEGYRNLQFRAQMRLYLSLAPLTFARPLVDRFFEELCHSNFLRDGISLKYMPMTRREAKKDSKHQPRYYSSHNKFPDEELEHLRKSAVVSLLEIMPTSRKDYKDHSLPSKIKPNVYYIPATSNQVAMDSFILFEHKLYVFQFTIGKIHDVKAGIVPFLKLARDLYPVVFIFVIPRDSNLLKCPYPIDSFLRGLLFHSARVQISKTVAGRKVCTASISCHCGACSNSPIGRHASRERKSDFQSRTARFLAGFDDILF